MKTNHLSAAALALVSSLILHFSSPLEAATTINSANKYAYGANTGWQDWRGDTANGVVIGDFVCSGSIYDANLGWISLGSGAPTNGIRYLNLAANDFGVNNDGLGNLRGFAYGANIGWVNFESNGLAKVDLVTGKLSGSIYSANCGWISLSNSFAHVRTDTLQPGADSDGDGIPDAWELSYTNTLAAFTATSDTDGDGMTDLAESGADTNPLDANDRLRITSYSTVFGGGNETNALAWTSKQTRLYQLESRTNLNNGHPWVDATGVFAPDPGASTARLLVFPGVPLAERYFQVQARKPLAP